MKWYGSLQNRLEEHANEMEIKVGMGVTEFCYSDREPYEVTKVIDARHIMVRPMDYKRVDKNGLSEMQEYEYKSNPEADEIMLFKTKGGDWREKYGRRLGCNCFGIGRMEKYNDPCF